MEDPVHILYLFHEQCWDNHYIENIDQLNTKAKTKSQFVLGIVGTISTELRSDGWINSV